LISRQDEYPIGLTGAYEVGSEPDTFDPTTQRTDEIKSTERRKAEGGGGN
jgi:hypothetical protein